MVVPPQAPLRTRVLKVAPPFAATLCPKTSNLSSFRTSNRNPNFGGANEPDPPLKPNQAVSPLVQFQTLKPRGLKDSLHSPKKRKLKSYTVLARHLAGEGHMLEFIKFLEMLADARLDREVFTSKLDLSQLDTGFTLILSHKQVDLVVNVMEKLNKAGYAAWSSWKLRKLSIVSKLLSLYQMYDGNVSECRFLVKKLIDPARVIASCAKARNLALAHSSFDVVDIMKELGVALDLFTYRAWIDSCCQCIEPFKAAVVFEVCPPCLKLLTI